MATITGDTRLVQLSRLPAGTIDGELMALDSKRGEVIGLDTVGTTIWSLLAEPLRVDELLERILERYAVDRDEARADLLPFLEELVAAGLIGPVA